MKKTDEAKHAEPEQNILTRMIRSIDRALASEPKAVGWEATARAILENRGGQEVIITSDERQRLRGFQEQHATIERVICTHTYIEAKAAWVAHNEKLAKAVQGESLHAEDGWSRENWETCYATKLEAAKSDRCRIDKLSLPVAQAVAERFCAEATRLIEEHEESERFFHDQFGIPYSPSPASWRSAASFALPAVALKNLSTAILVQRRCFPT